MNLQARKIIDSRKYISMVISHKTTITILKSPSGRKTTLFKPKYKYMLKIS